MDVYGFKKGAQLAGLFGVVVLCGGFAPGESIELTGYLNGRSSANFLKVTPNVRMVLPPGTRGTIQEIKKFASGNTGLLITVESGPRKGEKVWVLHHAEHPYLKLLDADGKPVARPDRARTAETTHRTTAYRDRPALSADDETMRAVLATQDQADALSYLNASLPRCGDVEIDSGARAIERNSNPDPSGASSQTIQTVGAFDVARRSDNGMLTAYQFSGSARNGINRKWEFTSDGNARQDLHFSVGDFDENSDWHSPQTSFYVFPRRVLPRAQELEGGRVLRMTLATGETVDFDAQTHQVIGGALREKPVSYQRSNSRSFPQIDYVGSGVVVEVSIRGDEPQNSRGSAVIKKGSQRCTVSAPELFTGGSSTRQFKYATDEEFNSFVRSRCGFSI